jgi:hypothetical protein
VIEPGLEASPEGGASVLRLLGRRTHRLLVGRFESIRQVTGRRAGPWRIAVIEASMTPAIEAGDWLLVDPTVRRWPRVGSIVVFTEPDTGELAIKRVAGRPGDRVPFADGFLHLAADDAWLISDADETTAEAAGFGRPRDSRVFGPVPLRNLVARAWFRYAPISRIGLIPRLHPEQSARTGEPASGAVPLGEPDATPSHDPAVEPAAQPPASNAPV